MIINKVQPYWTEKDRQKLEEIRQKQQALIKDLIKDGSDMPLIREKYITNIDKWQELEDESLQIENEVEDRYIRANNKDTLLSDAEEIVTAIEKKDFQGYIKEVEKISEDMKVSGENGEAPNILKKHAVESYENCYRFILAYVRVQLNAFVDDEENTAKIKAITEKHVSLWYDGKTQINVIRPKEHIMPNNALMNKLQEDIINAGYFDLTVSKAKKEITSYVMVSYEDQDISTTKDGNTIMHISEYERQVFNSIASIWIEAINNGIPPIIYPELVYKAMPGGSDKASPQQKGAITKVIEKFRRLFVYADITDEMRERGVIGEKETRKLDNYFITATHVEDGKTKNGRKTIEHAYLLTAEPIMLTYCKLTNQLLSMSADYLAVEKVQEFRGKMITTGELLPMTAPRQAMAGYLYRRILVMKHDENNAKEAKRKYDRRREKSESSKERPIEEFRKYSRIILFDTLFNDAGLGDQTKQSAANNRAFIFQVLDFLKVCKNPLIKDYKRQKKGHIITGIEIVV